MNHKLCPYTVNMPPVNTVKFSWCVGDRISGVTLYFAKFNSDTENLIMQFRKLALT